MIFKREFIECSGLWNITIHTKENKNKPLGRCTVIENVDIMQAPGILDFVIYSQAHRRKSFGSQLMNFVKWMFAGGIKSSFYSKAGKEFARKTGWQEVKNAQGMSLLYYSKELENGNYAVPEITTIDESKIIDFKAKEEKTQKKEETEVKDDRQRMSENKER